MAAERLSVICAWCQRVITPAPPGARVTHTICQPCLERTVSAVNYDETDPAVLNPPPDYFGDAFKH
jgi:hypothetical protein